MSEVYISIDIEADGPIPGDNSMLSLGAAAFILDAQDPKGWRMLGTHKVNLKPLLGAVSDPDTMKWWGTQPAAWAAATSDQQDPVTAMPIFAAWTKSFGCSPVLMGYPVTFDFMFVYWYTVKFAGYPTPFGFQGMDLKTMARDRMGGAFRATTKRNMPKEWFKGAPPHTHDALDDAIGQGVLGMNLLTQRPPR